MPKRVAATSADKQIDDYTGSGPFIFKKDEWRPGEKVVYVRNTRYAPRADPATGTAGGKIARVDRVEWIIITDPQTQANALATGEVDMLEMPAFELYRSLKRNPDIQLLELNPLGGQNYLRFNHLEPPFDNPKVRRAAMAALNQEMFLQVQVGVPGLYRTCFSVYPCKTPYATATGMDFIAEQNPASRPATARGIGLFRHAHRPAAADRRRHFRQASGGGGATPATGGLHRRHATHELAVAGVAAGAEDRLAHLHHEFTGRVPGGSARQFLAQRRLRQGVVWLAVRP